MKMILFDIDGTLLHTGGAGRLAFERVYKDLYGVADAWQDLKPDGKTDPAIIYEISERVFRKRPSQEDFQRISDLYHEYFQEELKRIKKFRLMPGVTEILKCLSAQNNFLLGIATGNFEGPAWLKLERGGLKSFFRFGGFGSDSEDRTELVRQGIKRGLALLQTALSPEKIYIIGDTPLDVWAGKNLGTKTIGVGTGRHSCPELKAAGADFVFQDLTSAEHLLRAFEAV